MQPKLKTSRGGIRLPMGIGGSDTLHTAPLPESATLYLDCPAGVIARPSVAVGDTVRRFSLLASPAGELGTPVYSPICGRVSRIGEDGTGRPTVTVTTDGGDAAERIAPVSRPLGELSADEIIALARGAGIICRSGLPMWKNIELSVGAAHTLIISALTSDPLDRSLLTLAACKPEALLCGVKIIQRALGIRRAAVVVPERGTAALSRLRAAAAADDSAELFRFITATEIYPMHEDAQLIYALAGPAMPDGAHPSDIGYAVFDAASCTALFETYATGAPCTRSAVTVTGDCVRSSATVLAATGTPIASLESAAGGLRKRALRIVRGGRMIGSIAAADDALEQCTGLVQFSGRLETRAETDCIRCGRCVSVCPHNLAPLYLSMFGVQNRFDRCEKYHIESCSGCGCCDYVCPSGIPLTENIISARDRMKSRGGDTKIGIGHDDAGENGGEHSIAPADDNADKPQETGKTARKSARKGKRAER